MKRLLLGFGILTLMGLQPLMAGSSRDGGEKQTQQQVSGPEVRAEHGEMATMAELEAPAVDVTPQTTETNALEARIRTTKQSKSDAPVAVKKAQVKQHPAKLFGKKSTHNGGSTFGMLSLIFGVIGFVFAWFLWPIGLALAICAIIFGVIGLSGGRPGGGMALAGLLLGIATILLPIFIYAWIGAM